jgi:hypothetical protein
MTSSFLKKKRDNCLKIVWLEDFKQGVDQLSLAEGR